MALTTVALRGENLYRFYHAGDDETLALRGVSISISSGEMIAVVGPSGSGKSTLLACLAGMDDPDGGTVYLAAERLSRRTERERALLRARNIGMLFQSGNLIETLTIRENAALMQQFGGRVDGPAIERTLDALGISERADALPGHLSGGELVRAGLAIALANDPRVILADEPTGEVDSVTELRVLDLLHEHVERGLAVVVVTHSDAVASAADRVVTLLDGQVSA
ncbi:MAG: ABC transporter ATP-binding protein [Candidatus Dormibacteria bacterium]